MSPSIYVPAERERPENLEQFRGTIFQAKIVSCEIEFEGRKVELVSAEVVKAGVSSTRTWRSAALLI